MHWPLIDKDDAKDHILDVADANVRSYAIMWQIVEKQIALGLSAIAVSPLAYPEGYAKAMAIVEKHHARLLVVETYLEEEEWKRRLNARKPGYSTHKISGWDAMQEVLRQYNGCWRYPIADEHLLRLDTSQPLHHLVGKVVDRVNS